jgi:predicted GNAT family acetyltransferase
MEVVHKNEVSEGVFFAKDGDRVVGEMTYVWQGNNHFIINHTEVINGYEGQGVGKEMVEKAVEFARESNCTIYPLCSFARHIFDVTPAYKDVLKGQ